MENLEGIYKFTFRKKKKQYLPEVHYICKRDDEKYFFYQLEGSNYISLEILLKSYLSQIIRLSIGQCLILIKLIYEKVIEVYRKEAKTLPKITLENIWIYTEKGFNAEIKPQKSMKIIFLNYQDEDVSIEENLKQLQQINYQIKKYCCKTEFQIRAKDGDSHFIQQTMNIIKDMFYEIEQSLYENPTEIKNTIDKYVNNETQETDYEYFQEDVQNIKRNFEIVIRNCNEEFKKNCQNELQLHRKLLNWQKILFDYFIENYWDRQGYELIIAILNYFEERINKKNEDKEYMTTEIEHKFFQQLEQGGLLNFNSKNIRYSTKIRQERELNQMLENEKYSRDTKKEGENKKKDQIDQKFEDRVQQEKEQVENVKAFNEKENIRKQNLDIIKNFYIENSQNRYKLYDRFYYTIKFQEEWKKFILDEILPIDKKKIDIHDKELSKNLTIFFEELLEKNKIGRDNEEEKQKYI
ncbi:unnamed protein product [Paramecium primaurelia]|uniref:Uncharacterized protein n=1 Tax=Paramecium primaurelia TaxID=5886 RepID=A0A8S1K804_PARPR|nr:unnamed protein product [Paramecium primaurelia]